MLPVAKPANSKIKLLYLMDILLEYTDEENPISLARITELLEGRGVTAERKSIYADIELLREYGLDVLTTKTNQFGYYIGSRRFELAELRLLVDAVQSSRFITRKKSEQLIKKLEGLASHAQARTLHREVFVLDRVKAPNEKIYYNVDILQLAIADGVQASFRYFEYAPDKSKRYRNDGEEYTVSPYALMWANDFYYLVAYYEKREGDFTHFRVDRMEGVRALSEKRVPAAQVTGAELDVACYGNRMFSMYGGEIIKVRLRCKNQLVNVVLDRFGLDVPMMPDRDWFIASVDVAISPMFLGWLFSFGGDMQVLSPESVIELLKTQVQSVVALYE